MQGVCRLVAIPAAGWLLANVAACHDRDSQDEAVSRVEAMSSVEPDDSGADEISAEAAVQLIKAQALNGGLRAMVRQPYTITRVDRTACGEAELVYDRNTYPQGSDLRLCKSAKGGAPYYKYTTKEETKCCRTVQVKVPADVRWKAAGRGSDGNWFITGSLSVSGLQYQAIWVVDAQTQEVCELPPADDTVSRSSRGYCSSRH